MKEIAGGLVMRRGKVTILECLYSYIEDATRDGQIM